MTVHEAETGYRIGEVAAAAGVTVRTLHYYDKIGLLTPSSRTVSGHRVYTDGDVATLYRISLLRRLHVVRCQPGHAKPLERGDPSPAAVGMVASWIGPRER